MAFIEASCKNCGAAVQLDDSQESGVCEFCGTRFLKQDLKITNHYHNNFANATVIYKDESSIEEKLKNAEVYLTKLDNSDEAKEIYGYVIKNKASDYRGWWGMARVLSKEFTYTACTEKEFDEIEKYANNAFKVADSEHQKELSAVWNNYSGKAKAYIEKTLSEKRETKRIKEEKRKHRDRIGSIRKHIGGLLSLASNIIVLVWFFVNDMAELADNEVASLLLLIGVLVGNSILTTIFGFIGATKRYSALPLITTALTVILTLIEMFSSVEHDGSFIIFLFVAAIFIGAGLLVIGVCAAIPIFALGNIDTADTVHDEET